MIEMQVTTVHRTVGNKNTTSYVLVGKYTEAWLCCQCARKCSSISDLRVGVDKGRVTKNQLISDLCVEVVNGRVFF